MAERHGVAVIGLSPIGLGCAPLGNLFTAVADADATSTIDAAWSLGIRYFDTAPLYGHGLSERRVGTALQSRPRDEFVLSTKVGRVLDPVDGTDPGIFVVARDVAPRFDFSRDGVLRSIDDSLTRLGLDRIDAAYVHDPDDHEREAIDGAFPALLELRAQGVVRAIGAGMNQAAMLQRFVEHVDLDVVLLAGRYTLLDRSGAQLLDVCAARGVDVVLGGVFNSGVLAGGTTFDYAAASPEVLARVERLRAACTTHGVPLPAAAIAFARRHPAVTSVILGARTPAEIAQDVEWSQVPIPDALWAELTV